MNNSEKIYLGLIGILCYILYFKTKCKNQIQDCNCDSKTKTYIPTIIKEPCNAVTPIVSTNILENTLVYKGPNKFELKSKTDVNISYLYFVKDGKYYKSEYNKINATEPSKTSEITIKEIIDAWNSTLT